MDREPLREEINDRTKFWADSNFRWEHYATLATQATGTPITGGHVKTVLELVGVQLQSCTRDEIAEMLKELGLHRRVFGSNTTPASGDLLNHKHERWHIEEGPVDKLATWRVACDECDEVRRVIRT